MGDLITNHDDWKKRLQKIIVDGVVQTKLEYAKEVYEYHLYCQTEDTKKGGSRFTENMLVWFGENKDSSSQLSAIGKDYDRLIIKVDRLPPAQSSLLLFAKMSDKLFAKAVSNNIIKQSMTTAAIKKFISDTEMLQSQAEQRKVAEEADKKNAIAVAENNNIPSEELLDDDGLELVGVDDDGNEIWEARGAPTGVSEVTIKDEAAEQERVNKLKRDEANIEKVIENITVLLRKAGLDVAEEVLDYTMSTVGIK
jgi:hypothetical protein